MFSLVDFGLAQWETELQAGISKGSKRKAEDVSEGVGENKKARPPLAEVATTTTMNNCSPAKARILRDHKSPGLRRSPRKLLSPRGDNNTLQIGGGHEEKHQLKSPVEIPKQKLNFNTPSKKQVVPVRCSPRKQLASSLAVQSRPGISKLKITANSILSPDTSTPSSTLQRVPSFTMLEPSGLSQATDVPGRTPLLRASMTSFCSSTIPKQDLLATSRMGGGTGTGGGSKASPSLACNCPGQLSVCTSCLSLSHLHAARAGTPGFRPPEVLLKCQTQTVAVDMWAAGIILLSILSRSYPFFRAPDDMTAIAELTTLFGSDAMKNVAKRYNRRIVVSHFKDECDLASICKQLAERGEDEKPPQIVTEDSIGLLKLLLKLEYKDRITASQAMKHPFVKGWAKVE